MSTRLHLQVLPGSLIWAVLFLGQTSALSSSVSECFKYIRGSDDLNHAITDTRAPQQYPNCQTPCMAAGFPYAGIVEGNQCYCGLKYGKNGKANSTACDIPCQANGAQKCGGKGAANIVYTVTAATNSRRTELQTTALNFDEARKVCVKNGGDVYSGQSFNEKDSLDREIKSTSPSTTAIWADVYKRYGMHEHTDPSRKYVAGNDWEASDTKSNDCAVFILQTRKYRSVLCTEKHAFMCLQTKASASTIAPKTSQPTSNKPRVEFYVALVIFFLCYGGACFLYGANRIYRACKRKKRKKVLLLSNNGRVDSLPGSETGQVKTVHVRRNDVAAGDDSVPLSNRPQRTPTTPQPRRREHLSGVSEPSPPPYIAMPGEKARPIRGVSPAAISLIAKSNRSSTTSMFYAMKEPPPPYDEDQRDPKTVAVRKAAERAMLLEKAVRDARERRRRQGSSMESRLSFYNAATTNDDDQVKKKQKRKKKDSETSESLLKEGPETPNDDPTSRSIQDIVRAKRLAREQNRGKRGIIST